MYSNQATQPIQNVFNNNSTLPNRTFGSATQGRAVNVTITVDQPTLRNEQDIEELTNQIAEKLRQQFELASMI